MSKSKGQYYDYLAKKLNNPNTSPKTYWAIMKTFRNAKKIPLIPLLPINDKLESDQDILEIIRALHVNKAHGYDDILIHMIKICDQSIIKPLSII